METTQTNWRVRNNQTAFTNPTSSPKPLETHENYPNKLDSEVSCKETCNEHLTFLRTKLGKGQMKFLLNFFF
jgi:hypothetical protein